MQRSYNKLISDRCGHITLNDRKIDKTRYMRWVKVLAKRYPKAKVFDNHLTVIYLW